MSNEWSTWSYNNHLVNNATTVGTGGQATWGRFQKRLGTKKWPRFANFFPWVKNAIVLSCSPNLLVKFELATDLIGHWWFSNFVPQPSEIVRKFLTGKMKHGYFFLPDTPSPLDIIWTNSEASELLAELTGPLVTGFYYMWLMQTSITAMNTFALLPLLFAGCPDNLDDTYLAEGNASFAGNPFHGAAVFYDVIQDAHNRYQDPGATVLLPVGPANSFAAGTFFALGNTLTNVEVYMGGVTIPEFVVPIGDLNPGETKDWSITWSYNLPIPYGLGVAFRGNITHAGLAAPEVLVTRWVTNTSPIPFPNPNGHMSTPHPCTAPGMQPIQL